MDPLSDKFPEAISLFYCVPNKLRGKKEAVS
jgi:hypothetical protein